MITRFVRLGEFVGYFVFILALRNSLWLNLKIYLVPIFKMTLNFIGISKNEGMSQKKYEVEFLNHVKQPCL